MSREEPLNPDLAGVEAALAGLQPSPSDLDRDRLMFLAGEAAGRRRARRTVWLGASTSAAATLAACVLGVLLIQRAGLEEGRQTANVPAAQPRQIDAPSEAANLAGWRTTAEPFDVEARYLELRQLVLTRGVEALPEIAPSTPAKEQLPTPPPLRRQMLDHLLDG